MARYAMLVDYEYCTGCHSCEVACQQEHGHPPGISGVVIREYEYELDGRVRIDNMPYFTMHCDLCMPRRARNEAPACVRHCQAACMEAGLTHDMAEKAAQAAKSVLYTYKPAK